MGWASEKMIEAHNALMESDAEYAENFSREMDAAQEADWFRSELDNERYADWFADSPIDHTGQIIELPECEPILIDGDIPF